MATPNMATITASLERSLQNCSLNNQHGGGGGGGGGEGASNSDLDSDSVVNLEVEANLELNSQGSLPFHWEQCLDLKTGEIYYINWRTGMRATEDPRSSAAEHGGGGEAYSDDDDDDDNSSYDSEDSSLESSPSSSREQWNGGNNSNNNSNNYEYYEEDDANENAHKSVLVVAGCKSCLMYYMVPKQLEICPKCCGQLLHFDRSGNGSSSS